jgi:hypothetical protein
VTDKQPDPSPPAKPTWWDTDVPVEDVAAELADYIDAVDQYVHLTCTPEYLRRKLAEILGRVTPEG